MAAPHVTVVMAIDPSKQAEQACEYYFDNIHKPGNKIVLANVIELPDTAHAREAYLSPSALAELWREEGEKSKQLDHKFQDIIKRKGVSNDDIKVHAEGGMKPGATICKIAVDEKASMIVMGTRGMGKVRRTIMGSVSDYVVHHATCPVVVCRHCEHQ